MKRRDKVYVDTNVIIEAHRVRCWKALKHEFDLHTVEACKIEALTKPLRTKPDFIPIPENAFDVGIMVHTVPQRLMVAQAIEIDGQVFDVDGGEGELIAHARTDPDAWVLTSPDTGAMNALKHFDLLDRATSLDELCEAGKIQPHSKFAQNYSRRWLQDFRLQTHIR